MHKKINILFFLFFITLFLFCGNVKAEQKILFEGVGNYAFATAGSNSANRGESYEKALESDKNYDWIYTDPGSNISNWSTVKKEIESKYGTLTNLTGSKLKADGEIKVARLYFFKTLQEYSNDVLLIKPDGSYKVYTSTNGNVDVTNFINSDNPNGWYYFSYLSHKCYDENKNAVSCNEEYSPGSNHVLKLPQRAWSITAVYENESLPVKYIKLIDMDNYYLSNNIENGVDRTVDVRFDSALKLKNKFQLVGTILAGGSWAYPMYSTDTSTNPTTEDSVYAILSDGTKQQLYEKTYNGKMVFAGRTNIDFANAIYSTERSTSENGGELDIFDETLSSDFFGGKEIIGYTFSKDGSDVIMISNVGLAQEIESPDVKIDADVKIKDKNNITGTVNITNISDYNGCNTKLIITLDDKIKDVTNVSIEPKNTTSYEIKDGKIIISFSSLFKAGESLNVTFDASLKESLKNDEKVDLNAVISTYPANGDACIDDIINNDKFKYQKEANDFDVYKEEVQQLFVPNTGKFTSIIIVILGILLIAGGIFMIYKRFRSKNNK